jgi:hypothetical protein
VQAVVQRAQFLAHQLAKLRVERAQRLVHHERQRLAHDGAPERHALAVAAGQAGHPLVEQVLDAQDARRLGDLGSDLLARHALRHQRKCDVVAHVQVRVQREQLEDEGDVAVRRALEGDVFVAEKDLAAGGQLEPGDHAQRGRLAAARRPEQAEELAVAHGEGRVLHRDEVGERLVQVLDADLGHG